MLHAALIVHVALNGMIAFHMHGHIASSLAWMHSTITTTIF